MKAGGSNRTFVFAVGSRKIAEPELLADQPHFLHQPGNMRPAYRLPLLFENEFNFLRSEAFPGVDKDLHY